MLRADLRSKQIHQHKCGTLRLSDMAFPLTDTSTPAGPLKLWNCFIDFAIEHWFGCQATEPGYTRDMDAVEMWLIDWYSEFVIAIYDLDTEGLVVQHSHPLTKH